MKAWPTPGVFPPLAHQGGWDETMLVIGPLLGIAGALWLANKRVAAQLARPADEPEAPPASGPTPQAAESDD